MNKYSTLSEMLLARQDSARRLHLIDSDEGDRSISLAELVDRALHGLGTLQAAGLTAGSKLVIFTDSNEQFLGAFWAAILGGIVPVPVAVGISDEHRQKLIRILRQLDEPAIFTNERLAGRFRDYASENAEEDILELLANRTVLAETFADGDEGRVHIADPDDLAFIQYSSGSTSDPKGVCLKHSNLVSNVDAIIESLDYRAEDSLFSWMPLTHDMGLIGYHIAPVVHDIDHGIMDTSVFVRRPLKWLQAVSDIGSTVLCSPNFGYKHYLKVFERKGAGEIDLSGVRLVLNGAEPISVALCDEFLAAMAPFGLRREAMLPVYGLAEATLAVTVPELGKEFSWISVDRHQLRIGEPYVLARDDDPDAMKVVKCGHDVSGCELRISGEDDVALPAGHVGHIQLHGPNITEGIFGDEQDEYGLFTADGWMRTGDVGAIADGELVITGRHKEIIIVNGQNYSPHDIEEAVATLDELDIGKVVACGAQPTGSQVEELLIFVLYRKDAESLSQLAHEIRQVVGQHIGLEVDYVIPVPRIPKTTSGKIQRKLLAQAYLDGEYDDVVEAQRQVAAPEIAADEDPLVAELLKICAEFSRDKEVGPDDNLFEVGISSLTLTEIMLAVDEKYPGTVDINDLFDYPTLRELADFLRRSKA